MKRAELRVGQELAWTRSRDYGYASKVYVVATEPYAQAGSYSWKKGPVPVERGSGVAVAVQVPNFRQRDVPAWDPAVVQLSQLEPWEAWLERKARRDARREESARLEEQRRRTHAAEAAAIRGVAEELGVDVGYVSDFDPKLEARYVLALVRAAREEMRQF